MERFGDIIGIAALGILSWQDFRSRQIAWWLLPILAMGILLVAFSGNSTREIGQDFSINVIFLVFQFLLIWIWFSLKNKKFAKIIDSQIGLGDLLFMICLALAFSPANFVVFYVLGMIFTLLITLFIKLFRKEINVEIPLAGALSIPLMLLCGWRLVDPVKNFYSDEWLNQLFELNP